MEIVVAITAKDLDGDAGSRPPGAGPGEVAQAADIKVNPTTTTRLMAFSFSWQYIDRPE